MVIAIHGVYIFILRHLTKDETDTIKFKNTYMTYLRQPEATSEILRKVHKILEGPVKNLENSLKHITLNLPLFKEEIYLHIK